VAKLYEMDGPEREAIFKAFESSSAAAKARLLIEKGWSQKNVGALTILRGWLVAENPDVMGQFFVNPEDKDFDAWMAWRLDSLDEAR
jgi:hypothetical protein